MSAADIFLFSAIASIVLWTLLELMSLKGLSAIVRIIAWLSCIGTLWFAVRGAGDLLSLLALGVLLAVLAYIVGRVAGAGEVARVSRSWLLPLVLILVIRTAGWEPYRIPSGSMLPTLAPGNYILVNRHVYGISLPVTDWKIRVFPPMRQPTRGEVVVFRHPQDKTVLVKRVIGLPGDQIEVRRGWLWVNGAKIQALELAGGAPEAAYYYEQFTGSQAGHRIQRLELARQPGSSDGFWLVPPGQLFVMGDNRDNSRDSRSWGTVPFSKVIGQVEAVWMHWEEDSIFPSLGYDGDLDQI